MGRDEPDWDRWRRPGPTPAQRRHDIGIAVAVLAVVLGMTVLINSMGAFAGAAAVWEPLVALGLLAGWVVLTVLLASRVYSGSLLRTGGRIALTKAWAHAD